MEQNCRNIMCDIFNIFVDCIANLVFHSKLIKTGLTVSANSINNCNNARFNRVKFNVIFFQKNAVFCTFYLLLNLSISAANNISFSDVTSDIGIDLNSGSFSNANIDDCNNPLTGKGVVIDEISGNCLLCGNADLENLIDGDLSNYTTFSAPLTVLSPLSVVSIKDVQTTYAAGERVGFVIDPIGGLLSSSILSGFQIRTYVDNVLQETKTGSALTVQLQGGLQRLSFVTTQPYDEVELRIVSVLGVLSAVRVYYAYGEPADGCDYGCEIAVAPPSYSSSINESATGIFGLCILCSLTNRGRVVDGDTTNFAHISLPIGVGGNAVIAVQANEDIPAGYEVGFAVRQGSGLLNLTLLGAITISTYDNGAIKESVVATASLADITLLGATDINLISFRTTEVFDEVRIRVNGISILVDLDVFYAFVRPDDDDDGFTNCVDKCPGEPDYLDADGDGVPDGCDDLLCMLNAGLDVSVCPPFSEWQFVAAGVGQSWTPLNGNPALALIDNSGAVSGMDVEGIYGFVLSEGTCHDTVYIYRFQSTLDAACNNPIVGPNVVITDPGAADCLLCVGAEVVIDGVLTGYVTLDATTNIIGATTILAVKDTAQIYPAGRRAGFVVQSVGGLLNATLLANLQIRTYLDGVLQETAVISGNVLVANALTGDGALQRLSFITTLSFDEIELVATATLNLLTELRVFYAFEEPETGCEALNGLACIDALTVSNNTFCGQISYERTGIVGLACIGCFVDNLGNLIDDNLDNRTTIRLSVGVGASGRVSVLTRQVVPAGYTTGFVVSGPANLLDATVLGGLWVRTFLNGVLQEEYLASGGLLQTQVLDASLGLGQLSFVTTLDFDEVQLRVDGLVSALETVYAHYAFVLRDTDGDGAPDCADKCCGGDDRFDANGNGFPDSCDAQPNADDDMVSTDEDTEIFINVLLNDDFGNDGPGSPAIEIIDGPSFGMATLDDNGTPDDPSDDFIIYTPDADYFGPDELSYRICDSNGDCDTATVSITVNPINDAPIAIDDDVSTPEGQGVIISVLDNDSDVDDDINPSSVVVLIPPINGVAIPDPLTGNIEYTPDNLFFGIDSFQYVVCDLGTPTLCDTAVVVIEVTATNVRLALKMRLQGALYGSIDTLMRDNLRVGNHLPASEPYTALSPLFIHVNGGGGELVSNTTAVFADNGPNSIVDWVFVELRDSSDLAQVIATRSALLQRDGDVVDIDGHSLLVFGGMSPASFAVAVRHRNHLGAMTETSIPLSSTGTQIDFTNLSTPLYDDGTNLNGFEQIVINEKFALWAGNVNANRSVVFAGQNNDKDPLFNQVDQAPGNLFRSQTYQYNGYHLGDVNMDGKAIFAGQNNDVDPIFNNVDAHPRNILRSQTFIIREQLAHE